MVGGGAAALAGLVFIAMSINLPIITRAATHKNRAVATMTGFTAVFMICALALIGNQSYQWIGVEWLVVSLVPTITYVRVYVRARKIGRSSVGLSIGRFIAGTACYLAQIIGSVLLNSRICCRTLRGLRSYGALLRFLHFRRMAPHHRHSRESGLNSMPARSKARTRFFCHCFK
jgi:hypothetical protein